MPPNHVIAFYATIGFMVLVNTLLYMQAHKDDIVGYEEEVSPLFDGPVKWEDIGRYINWAMNGITIATVVILFLIYAQVNRAAQDANIDMATGIALSVLNPGTASLIRARYP